MVRSDPLPATFRALASGVVRATAMATVTGGLEEFSDHRVPGSCTRLSVTTAWNRNPSRYRISSDDSKRSRCPRAAEAWQEKARCQLEPRLADRAPIAEYVNGIDKMPVDTEKAMPVSVADYETSGV